MRAVGYVRVSTEEQGRSGLGLEAQRRAIAEAVALRSWELVAVHEDVASGASTRRRPGLAAALEACRSGGAEALVVAKLDRLSRSVVDAGRLLDEARRRGFNVVALDFGLDLSTPQGELVANVLASVAQWERRVIGQRIAEALEAKRAGGWRPPRPAHQTAEADEARVLELHRRGLSQRAIAAALTERDGRRWHKETVARVLRRSA